MYKREYGIWTKLDNSPFNLDYDIFLAFIYIRPKYSHQDNEEILSKLTQDIADLSCLGEFFLSGDFNCRTVCCQKQIR